MRTNFALLCLALLATGGVLRAQTSSASATQPGAVPHTTVPYRITDPGTKLPDITWGLDLAWISEGNVQRGVNFAGADLIDIIRLSFQTTSPVTDGTLSAAQRATLNTRINIAKKYAPKAGINLNSDQEAGVDEWYHVYRSDRQVSTFAPRWAALIAATKSYVESKGLKVVSVSPFNEPDYGEGQTWGWQQGSKAEMLEICRLLREDEQYAEDFKDVLLCGGNTLNDDYALPWYNYCKQYLDEGNTHQLAGSFDNFATFYQTVAADGKTAVGDELHNTMECMVGSEYGLTKGIWWGTCDHARSQFMKASRGTRLGYAEHRANWTAAGVYRHPDGRVQAFGGTSERQAVTTLYRLAALDHDVFYNGQGPTREYLMNLPGGTGYQKGQTNAETVVDIQDGEDIMPAMPTAATTYKLVNRASGMVLSFQANTLQNAANLTQERAVQTGNANLVQQWVVRPMGERTGGDFSYYKIMNARDTTMLIDVRDWSLTDRGGIIGYRGGLGDNEQWFLDYAGDGWFYIRSRHSAFCLEVTPGTATQVRQVHRAICQGPVSGAPVQHWRLLPADVTYDAVAPASPTLLAATPQPGSVRLSWRAPEDEDVAHYVVLRSQDGQTWHTLHNRVPGTLYVDNTAQAGTRYTYKVCAVDLSLNRSEASEPVAGAVSGEHAIVCHVLADSLLDDTGNGNHAAMAGTFTAVAGKFGQGASLNGTNNYMQLPATIANSEELTVCGWFYWRGGNTWQRLFDFGTDTDHYVFLTTNAGSGPRLAIKNGGAEEVVALGAASFGTNRWRHVAVTFSASAITVYLDGTAVATNTTITTRPCDFRPVFNYIGRSQFTSDPLLRGNVDDVRIYNYALTAADIAQIADGTDRIAPTPAATKKAAQDVYTLDGLRVHPWRMQRGRAYIINGRKTVLR